MNQSEIERTLGKAPRPIAPRGLRERLLMSADEIPTTSKSVAAQPSNDGSGRHFKEMAYPTGWFRRWWAVLVPTGATLLCVGILAAQNEQIRQLKAEIRTRTLEPKPIQQPTQMALPIERVEPSAVSYDAEIARLRELVAQLTDEVSRLERAQEMAAASAAKSSQDYLTAEEASALQDARDRALRIQCVNNLKQFGLACRVWAVDNEDITPPSIQSMSNELSTPKILVCPADTERQFAANFSTFTMANCSYEYLAPSAPDNEPYRVLSRCPIHSTVGLLDGSVHSGVPATSLTSIDGILHYTPPGSKVTPATSTPIYVPGSTSDEQRKIQEHQARERFLRRYGLTPSGNTESQP